MSNLTPSNAYNTQHDDQYALFESGNRTPTNAVAYRVVGQLAYDSLYHAFGSMADLRVCDVGCYLGASTRRWWEYAQSRSADFPQVRVLGTDIHAKNVESAIASHGHLSGLSFRLMLEGGPIPLIDAQTYHMMFAAFVLDTIPSFEGVVTLCRNMVEALDPQGAVYILRLHPNALNESVSFREYTITPRSQWQHGDPLHIQLRNLDNELIDIHDKFWSPKEIDAVFSALGCDVEMISVSKGNERALQAQLEQHVAAEDLSVDMPEWSVPLYQIIQARKR